MPDPKPRPPSLRSMLTGVSDQPPAPPPQRLSPAGAERQVPPSQQPPTPPLAFLQRPLNAAIDLIRGGTVGATGGSDSPWAKGAELAMAALPVVGGVKEGALATSAGRGLYSRIDDILQRIPAKGIHPNKLASLLKSGASQEEVAYRNLPALISGKAEANQVITPEELRAHLQAHPAPFPSKVVLGEPEARADLRRPTKFGTYTEPGGENYRETLYTLPDPTTAKRADLEQRKNAALHRMQAKVGDATFASPEEYYASPIYKEVQAAMVEHNALNDELRALPPATGEYKSGHFDEPNIVTHARHKDREIPVDRPTALPEHYQVHQDTKGKFYYQTPDGTGGVQDYATAEQATRAAMEHAGQLNPVRGRFLEEVQSDWHQAGKRSGYAPPDVEAQAEAASREWQQALEARKKYQEEFEANWKPDPNTPFTPRTFEQWKEDEILPEFHTPEHDVANRYVYEGDIRRDRQRHEQGTAGSRWQALQNDPTFAQLTEAQLQADGRAARLKAMLRSGVPDAPFKETWPDLALKQQLLDTAENPALHWLGFTGGQTQARRYDLSKQVSAIEYDNGMLTAFDHDGYKVLSEEVPRERLADYIGKEGAERLLSQPGTKTSYHGPDDEGYRRLEGESLQVGGEGMRSFYDKLLPKRLEKIVKPLGGTVEPFELPGSRTTHVDTPGFSIVDQEGYQRGWFPTRTHAENYLANPPHFVDPTRSRIVDAMGSTEQQVATSDPSWLVRLTPEMRARILKEGFPLMMLPLATAATLRWQQASQTGTEPPVSPGTAARPTP